MQNIQSTFLKIFERKRYIFWVWLFKALPFCCKGLHWSSSSRSSRLQMFFKIRVLKNFEIFTEKPQCWNLFLIKLQAWRPVFLWILRNFQEQIFDRIPLVSAFAVHLKLLIFVSKKIGHGYANKVTNLFFYNNICNFGHSSRALTILAKSFIIDVSQLYLTSVSYGCFISYLWIITKPRS